MDRNGLDPGSEGRFVESMSSILGHADRIAPFRSYCTGLILRANARASNRLPRVSSPIVSRPRINRSTISSRRPSGPMKRC